MLGYVGICRKCREIWFLYISTFFFSKALFGLLKSLPFQTIQNRFLTQKCPKTLKNFLWNNLHNSLKMTQNHYFACKELVSNIEIISRYESYGFFCYKPIFNIVRLGFSWFCRFQLSPPHWTPTFPDPTVNVGSSGSSRKCREMSGNVGKCRGPVWGTLGRSHSTILPW